MNKSNRITIALLVVVFVLPVILAKFALENDWFNRGSTNRGELLAPPLNLSAVMTGAQPSWRILYVMPDKCDVKCSNALYSLEQVWVALGRQAERAQATVLLTKSSDVAYLSTLSEQNHLHLLTVDQQNVNLVFKDVAADGIFLVDTLNNAMLRYPLQEQQEQAVMDSRDMLADLKKLLKLSRIG
ncbi:MAG: hypothetical protein ACPH9N_01670 [Alteromonas sp.]